MDNITYKYFIGDGDEAKAVIEDANEKKQAHLDKISVVLQKYGADCAWGPSRSPLCAIGFKCERDSKPAMKENFLKPKVEPSGEKFYAVYYPDKRYKGGKEIKADLEDVGVFNFSDYVTEKLGIYRACFGTHNGSMVRALSAAGQYGDRLVFRIPQGGETRGEGLVIPPFIREIKESEFIAITKEGA